MVDGGNFAMFLVAISSETLEKRANLYKLMTEMFSMDSNTFNNVFVSRVKHACVFVK